MQAAIVQNSKPAANKKCDPKNSSIAYYCIMYANPLSLTIERNFHYFIKNCTGVKFVNNDAYMPLATHGQTPSYSCKGEGMILFSISRFLRLYRLFVRLERFTSHER